jgi:hypothetical protein
MSAAVNYFFSANLKKIFRSEEYKADINGKIQDTV